MPDNDVKQLIIDTATTFFSKYGFHKTTMDEIARHIHKAKGVLYYYFKSKEELFNEVVKQELDRVKNELVKIVQSDIDALAQIEQYFLTRLRLLNSALNYHETLKADFFEKYHFVKDVRDDFAAFEYEQLQLIINKAIKQKSLEVQNIDTTVNAVMMLATSLELPLYLQNKYNEYEQTIVEIVSMVIHSIRSSSQ
jgi:AcrR family transcriptional regulator